MRQWLPKHLLVVVADSSYAAIELLVACKGLAEPVTLLTRLRLDAALYDLGGQAFGLATEVGRGSKARASPHRQAGLTIRLPSGRRPA